MSKNCLWTFTYQQPLANSPLAAISPKRWYSVGISIRGVKCVLRLDGKIAGNCSVARRFGETIRLDVERGVAFFDDLEIRLLRRLQDSFHYGFDRRECDWERSGREWVDHAGIACALASNWISLIAPEGSGWLRCKRPLGFNPVIAFDIQENSSWYGWTKKPSHKHHAYNNICIRLEDHSGKETYRLEINTGNHDTTLLKPKCKPF